MPGGRGGDNDSFDDSSDDFSNTTISDTEQNFRCNNPEDDLNNVTLAFEPFAQFTDTMRDLTHKALRWKWNANGSKPKVWEPDPFDGSDLKKLCPFVVQYEIDFQANLKSFQKEMAKVTFAQSYLGAVVLKYFKWG